MTGDVTTCPSCEGWGVLSDRDALASCPTCHGRGVWVGGTPERPAFSYPFPPFLKPTSRTADGMRQAVRYVAACSGLVLTLGGAAGIFLTAPTASTLLWQRDWYHVGFGLGGILVMYSLALLHGRRSSALPLHDLPANSPTPVDLSQFAHQRVGELLEDAARTAADLGQTTVSEEVLLYTLLVQPRIQAMVARLEHVPDDVAEAAKALIPVSDAHTKVVTLDPQVRQRVLTAVKRAHELHFPYLDSEDILLAFAEDAAWQTKLLKQFDLTPKAVLAVAAWYAEEAERSRRWAFWQERGRVKPKGFMNRGWTALPTPFLDQFSRDLTVQAASGYLPLTLARDAEVARCFEVLGNPTKHNLLILGEPGVGKTTVLQGIAFRMADETVPEALRDHRLVELDVASLLSSGNPEQNVRAVLDEVNQAGNVILAIPDIQSLVATSEGPLDAAALLASELRKGSLQVISSATYGDYHRFVEQNALLSNAFTIVEISPPTIAQTIAILEEEGARIESREGVFLTYPAIEQAAILADKFLTDQVPPQSAISLLGEASSLVKAQGKRWVRAEAVQEAVEKRTGVPVQQAGAEESERLLNLEAELHKRIVGQNQAVDAVANALRRARAGLHNGNRPIATFLFVGPTGVGKTEMAKAVAALHFGKEEAFVRFDMSEYQEGTAVYKLIGPPPASSHDFTEGGTLTQPIREHPFSLILLDEIEKAHPDVLNLFLQLLDDGRVTENTGRTVQFRNTIIVATSNAASVEISRLITEGVNPDQLPKQMLSLLQQHFKPEFLNRFDAIVPFQPLTPDQAKEVTSLLLNPVIANAAEQGITLSFTPDAIALLAEQGYDPQFGARPLRRIVQDKVEALLAKQILSGSLKKGDSLEISADMVQ